MQDLDQLIRQCLTGDERARFMLYDRYVTAMYNTTLRIVGDAAEAEDVLQDGFVKVFAHLHTFRGEATIGTWIKKIMITTALNHLRSRKKLPFAELPVLPDCAEEESPEEAPWDARTIHEAIKKLPEGARVVFTLYAVEELGHKDIAQTLGITESTSKTQYMRARRMLQTQLLALKKTETF